jgi:hypothetical protein
MFKPLDFTGGSVAGQHDLFMCFVQRVERVEKFFLNSLFAREKLDVVNQQHVGLPVFFAELGELVVLNPVNVFVRELFRRQISDARTFFIRSNVLADCVEQMRLAKPDAAVKKKRIVRFSRRLCDSERSGVGEIIVVADDKCLERVFWIEGIVAAGCSAFVRGFGRFCFCGCASRRGNWSGSSCR